MSISRRLRFEILRRDDHTCRYCGRRAPDVQLTVDHVIPTTLGGSDDPSNLVACCAECNAGKSSVPAGAPLVEEVAADALRWRRAIEQARAEFEAERQVVELLLAQFHDKWTDWTYPVEVEVPPEPVPPTDDPVVDNWHRIMGWTGRNCEPVSFEDGVLTLRAEVGWTTEVRSQVRALIDRWADVLDFPHLEAVVLPGERGRHVSPPPAPPRPTKVTERRDLPLGDNWEDSVTRFLSLGMTIDDLRHFVDVAMRRPGVTVDETWRYFCGCCWRHITDLQESARRILEQEEA